MSLVKVTRLVQSCHHLKELGIYLVYVQMQTIQGLYKGRKIRTTGMLEA